MKNFLFESIRNSFSSLQAPFIQTAEEEIYSYEAMLGISGRFAHTLVSQGVKAGDRVCVQVEKSPQAIFLYLACVRAGAVFVPLNTAYTLNELDYFISDASPKLIIVSPIKADELNVLATKYGAHLLTLGEKNDGTFIENAKRFNPDFKDITRNKDDLAALLYTSGTTGRSKGAMLTHNNLASNAKTLAKQWRFTHKDVLLHALPIFHTHGLFVATNVTLMAGSSLILLPKFDPNQLLQLFPKATCMMGVPTFYVRLLQNEQLTKANFKNIRLFVSGSAPLLAETHREWQEKTGHAILERYGMTETNMITSNPYDGKRVAGAVGLPLEGVYVRITNTETNEPLPQGEIGMIEVKGENVFQGYWQMPEKTKAEFRQDGYFITGDLGFIDKEGYLHIVGRGKDLVITGGYNVYPKEIEDEIDAINGVLESAVIGLPHKDFGEAVTAVVVLKNKTLVESDILKSLEMRLAKYKQPKRIIFADDLPRNTMGKVQKNILRKTHNTLYT